MQIQSGLPPQKPTGFALFNLGFRPFFLGAGVFALVSMSAWIAIYLLPLSWQFGTTITAMQWHAHEMIYGYGLAVIAGFLLTAVKNWTGIQTLHGRPLLGLFSIWLVARLLLLGGSSYLILAAFADLLFGLVLMVSIARPIIKVCQWKQLAVLSKLILIVAANMVFYLGALGYVANGAYFSIYAGLYIVISLILVLGRRVIPLFIERGVSEKVILKQHRWADLSILLFFLVFFVNELFIHVPMVTAISTAILFLVNGFRLYHWHTPGIWKAPLLWSLYVSSWLINAAFLLLAVEQWLAAPRAITLHLFTVGGIGLMTVAMMARVSLGHTGRDIKQPSPLLAYALAALVLSAVFRVFLPLVDMQHYLWWVTASYVCWILAFSLFLVIYVPVLTKPRLDGQQG